MRRGCRSIGRSFVARERYISAVALHELLARRFGWHVSRSSFSRFLRSMALKPHRGRYWLNPSDPDFDTKAAKICKHRKGRVAIVTDNISARTGDAAAE